MGRKKKKEEPELTWVPSSWSETYRDIAGRLTMTAPSYSTITTIDGVTHTYIHHPSTNWGTVDIHPPIVTHDWKEYAKLMGKKEEAEVNVVTKKIVDRGEHIVFCDTILDLLPERILTTLSAAKGKLMFEVAPIHIKEIQCKMTPNVKNNIIEASKRLKRYGKKCPIIPSFDEYGNRLPDQIEIGDNRGIVVQIVDPKDYGEIYFELKAIEIPRLDYTPDYGLDSYMIGDDYKTSIKGTTWEVDDLPF